MFVRLKFPVKEGLSYSVNYLILYEYQFSINNSYDVLELSQIFGQSPILKMILGSQKSFTLSGSLFIKNVGTNYVVDGLYNSSFNLIHFLQPKYIIDRFNQIAKDWNDGVNNTNVPQFEIQYVQSYNETADVKEKFLPESFSYSFSSRDPMLINVSISGKIGEAIISSL